MASSPLYNLVIELPGRPPRHYLLSAASIRIGRVEGNSIVAEEATVSSRHCELRRSGIGYEIVDLDSTNGTKVNGESLGGEPRELHDGDSLQLGLVVRAQFVRIREIRDRVKEPVPLDGSVTRRLERLPNPERPAINPVAAAVAKAARAKSAG